MGKVIRIREVGDPILKMISEEVEISKIDSQILDIIDDMKQTLEYGNGCGIAASQIGINKRIIVVGAKKENIKYNDAQDIPITAMINPSWKKISEDTDEQYEGCMSVPQIRGEVERYKEIELTYWNEKGEKITKKLNGFFARLIQHECDHLDGIVFLEKVKKHGGFATIENINKYKLREKTKILFATTNPAKVKKYAEELENRNVELVTIKDLNLNLQVNENGKDAIENAKIKAKTYYDATGITTIGMDNNLFIEELPEEKQPGTHVRRVNGKELTDQEMIEYYTNLVKENGGKLTAKWVYGMAICKADEIKTYTWSKDHFYFVEKPSENRNAGYPLDSISIIPEFNKYLVDLTEEEKRSYKEQKSINEVIEFIINNI